jgi:uncharacterized membrane protein
VTETSFRHRALLPLMVLAYIALLLAGALSGTALPFRLAVPAMLVAVALSLPMRRMPVAMAWCMCAVLVLWLDWRGHAHAILDTVPVLINAGLCFVFARTLRADREPLVTRVVRLTEGPERLESEGIARYTRQVTWYWAILLGVQVLLLCACWTMLASARPEMRIWARIYLHVGGYLLPGVAMLTEYLFRRWYFRHLPQPGPVAFLRQLVTCWPQIVRGARDTLPSS